MNAPSASAEGACGTNRHERRRRAAMQRRERKDRFYRDYLRHLPMVPLDAPYERGRVYHTVYAHDPDCGINTKPNATLDDCTCNVEMSRHVEPRRS